jgi:adenine/guanine/hypoxanthine permease
VAWTQGQIDNALSVAGTSAAKVAVSALVGASVIYNGMATLGAGTVVVGLILGAIPAFVIDRDFKKAALYARFGAVLSFFGFIHSPPLAIPGN